MSPEELAGRVEAADDPEQAYEIYAAQPLEVRRSAYGLLSTASGLSLWEVQLSRYKARHAMTPEQREVIAFAEAIIRDAGSGGPDCGYDLLTRLEELRSKARGAFGREEAAELFATLGPPDPSPDGAPG